MVVCFSRSLKDEKKDKISRSLVDHVGKVLMTLHISLACARADCPLTYNGNFSIQGFSEAPAPKIGGNIALHHHRSEVTYRL